MHEFDITPSEPFPSRRNPSQEARERHRERQRAREKTRTRHRTVDPRERRMIAWDGEGMKLRGPRNPQSYVLFGCSADPTSPLVIQDEKDDLDFIRIADYACDIAEQFPHAFHVGYFFGYDQNMIVKHLPMMQKLVLYSKNSVQLSRGDTRYRIKWIPKKRLTITRETPAKKTSLTIDDIAPFFQSSFVSAYASLFGTEKDSAMFERVKEGKALRADMLYRDMDTVREYWEAEIVLLEQFAERFRSIMYDAGFILREWYGPGALANYIRREKDLARHEYGGKEAVMPAEVHDASKRAYFGGRFEQFQAGRIRGPVYAYDIRSAYPAAFTQLPSLREGGTWVQVTRPTPGRRFGVYRLRYRQRDAIPWKPQPLPHRSVKDANVTFPGMVDGWYWTPEAASAVRNYRAEILGGWEWVPADEDERPWSVFHEMYEHRARLKAMGNPMQLAFKLGPNSYYGKMAQRIGYDEKAGTPPRAHTLPIAGWITAYCRAEILDVLARMHPGTVVAVETDGIFSTTPPDELGIHIGDDLGEWEVKTYDEMVYVQSGVYLCRQGDEWHAKTRGMDAASVTYERVMGWLRGCDAGDVWEPMELPQRERFLGLGAAVSRAMGKRGMPSPFKLDALHCRWEIKPRALAIGEKGKRIHVPAFCPACERGESAAGGSHRLVVHSPAAQKNPISSPYVLPWEKDYREPEWLAREKTEREELSREET